MSLPTTASIAQRIEAPPVLLYDLVADIGNMGRWSPECRRCEWIDGSGHEGSRFRGHNRSGLFRWTTEAEVLVADRGREFSFATLHQGEPATRWTYRFDAAGQEQATVVTETFEAIQTPPLIAFAERYLIRHRQQQLEAGIRATLDRLKAAAEAEASARRSAGQDG
jgi:hypothetical protein